MITPEWSPQSSWQLTSILSQPKRPSMGFLDFLALRLHHWAQTCRVLRRNGGRSQPSKMGTINFHSWRSQKKKMATYRQFWETSAGVFFRLCDTFPLPQIVPSARNEAPENKTSHSDCDIVKSMSKTHPLQHSDQASTWYSVLLPASKDLKSSWSIAGVTSCYTAKYHLTHDSFKQKLFSLYLNLDHILLIDKLKDVKSIYLKKYKLQLSTSLLSHEFTSVSVFLRHKKPNAPHLEVHQCCTSTVHG